MASLAALMEMAKLQSDSNPPQPGAIIATASESPVIKNEGGPDADQGNHLPYISHQPPEQLGYIRLIEL
jgi:hypothetical protein